MYHLTSRCVSYVLYLAHETPGRWFGYPGINTKKTYNTRYSLVVTDPTTNPALRGLTMGEQTGPRILHELWSYVTIELVR
ncbi:Alpha-ketoglutarate-dependent sulfonate dioxygenase [Fusarium oxysporum f. sp. albedinis]|nr:Alpha-ketoglutarate-dependent sulfonate dioxygenase [Fusarium oxysporum f. sp. albedinis]